MDAEISNVRAAAPGVVNAIRMQMATTEAERARAIQICNVNLV
jgi:hypothetical protein